MIITASQQRVFEESSFGALVDYRRAVADIYAELRRPDLSLEEKYRRFRLRRDVLFATHPQSALSKEQQANFTGLPYYAYDPTWRFVLPVDRDVEPEIIEVELQHDGLIRLQLIHFGLQCSGA